MSDYLTPAREALEADYQRVEAVRERTYHGITLFQ